MKITTIQYAKSLYELTAGKSKQEIDVISEKFIKFVIKNRQKKLLPKIIGRFSEIWNKENGIVEAEVITAKDLDRDLRVEIEKFMKEKYEAKEIVLANKIDENIKGGIIIKVGDEILDASVERQLQELKNILSK